MSNNIRVDRRSKKIEVNDEGEFIVLPFGDQEFVPKMLSLLNEFEEYAKQQRERAAEIDAMPENTEKLTAAANLNLEACRILTGKVNDLFGEDACTKIFGPGVPSLFAFADFFDQLAPFVHKFADEEAELSRERIRKYSEKYHFGAST